MDKNFKINMSELKTNKPKIVIRKFSNSLQTQLSQPILKEFYAETFGTCLMILIGLGALAQTKLSSIDDKHLSDLLSPNILAGLSLAIAILVTGKITKAHFNPAISLAMLLTKQMKLIEFLVYTLAQFIGAFMGAALVFLVYFDAISDAKKSGSLTDISTIFVTLPNKSVSQVGIIADQIIATAVYLILILAFTDKKNFQFSPEGTALMAGVALFSICSTLSYNSGSPLNPARDFSPRFFISLVTWNGQVYSNNNYYFWTPIVCPMIGSAIGTGVYSLVISKNLK
ncbi:aquaporin-9 [Brachionus plicatilis]|uniref:Aquaporin-9 n=1 Tax=Brachionus plicatilis TaxID=10195 RepID=A0A3M7SG55_BRAPC|nr:aquaporin-9 [Brachionus plicatilis]